jgi:hypothetical protein
VRNEAFGTVHAHTLSGVADLSVDAGLTLQYPDIPEISVLYGQTGDYIYAVGSGTPYLSMNGTPTLPIPDIRIKGRQRLDVQVAQKFLRYRLQLILGASNLLASPYVMYQDLDGDGAFGAALKLRTGGNGQPGYYDSGTDNTIINLKSQKNFYVRISWMF